MAGETVRDPGPPPPLLQVLVVSAEDLVPLGGAEVAFDDSTQAADGMGRTFTEWYERAITVRAALPGYEPRRLTVTSLPESGPVQVELVPVVLTGTVTSGSATPVAGARVTLGDKSAVTDDSGNYRISGAAPGSLLAARPAWITSEVPWDGRTEVVDLVMDPRRIVALRITAPAAADPVRWGEFLAMADDSAVNAFVLDTKDEAGEVKYATSVATANEIGAARPIYDPVTLLADMKEHGIYSITRIVAFQDSPMAEAHPEFAVRNRETGGVWKNDKGQAWVDPTDQKAWDYPLQLAAEACRLGFDEIQFDYVRFPSDGPVDALQTKGPYNEANRVATIAAFLSEAKKRLNALGCAVAADIFAVVVSTPDDQGIGQKPEELSRVVDVISPMVYPTHYARGWDGYANPNDHPAEIVSGTLDDGLERNVGSAVIRPWLQTSTYGPAEITAEISAAVARGLGWMLWSSTSIFDPAALPPADPGLP